MTSGCGEKLERQLPLFDDPEVGLVFCGHIDTYDDTDMTEVVVLLMIGGDLSQFVFKFIFCTTSMMVVRRDVMLAIGCFDEKVGFWRGV